MATRNIALSPEEMITLGDDLGRTTFYYSGQREGHEYLELPDRRYLRLPISDEEIPGRHQKAYSIQDLLEVLPGSISGNSLVIDFDLQFLSYGNLWRVAWTEDDDTYDFIRGNQPEITVENSLINALYKTLLWTKNYKK